MPTAHCVSTIDGIILEVDRGFLDLVQRPEREVIGASYRSITYHDDLDRSARMLASLVNRAPPYRLQKRYVRPDGSWVAANVYVTRFDNPDRLVSTLHWTDRARPLPPAKLWEAALRAHHMYALRLREFGADVAADPVGSVLITLYLAEAEGRVTDVEDVATRAGLSPAVAARWLKVLRQRGILAGSEDRDGDVQFSQSGLERMERLLASAYDVPLTREG